MICFNYSKMNFPFFGLANFFYAFVQLNNEHKDTLKYSKVFTHSKIIINVKYHSWEVIKKPAHPQKTNPKSNRNNVPYKT